MVDALQFTHPSQKFTAPPLSEGLPQGLVLQVWLRRTGEATGAPIVALVGAGSSIVLGVGDRPDKLSLAVVTGGTRSEISAPGALPIDRWVQVRAVLWPKGWGQLEVLGMHLAAAMLVEPGVEARVLTIGGGGFVGEMAQLQVWKHHAPAVLSSASPILTAPNLWAYYPLAAVTEAGDQWLVEEVGPNKRHASTPKTAAEPARRVRHEEALERDQEESSSLSFEADSAQVSLAPLSGLSGSLSAEVWARPLGEAAAPVIQWRVGGVRVALVVGGPEEELSLVMLVDDTQVVLCQRKGLIKREVWSHVAVALRVRYIAPAWGLRTPTLEVALMQQGQQRAAKTFSYQELLSTPAGLLQRALAQSFVPELRAGGRLKDQGAPFHGELAELRLWDRWAVGQISQKWLERARGDEEGLVACYRLDTRPQDGVVDVSRRRGLAQAGAGVRLSAQGRPPIAATSGAPAFQVRGRGKLLSERLPAERRIGSKKINLSVTNTSTGEVISTDKGDGERRVFDATIEVVTRGGNAPVGASLELRVDAPMTRLSVVGAELVRSAWAAETSYVVAIPGSGRLRLRFAAEQLACPTIRARVVGAPGSVWTIVRPDETAQQRLMQATAGSLMTPADGRRSPLPPGASEADAQALASAISRLATQLAPASATAPSSSPMMQSKIFSVIKDWVVDTAGDTVNVVTNTAGTLAAGVSAGASVLVVTGEQALSSAAKATKSASALVVRSVEATEALVKKAKEAPALSGTAAITAAIEGADQLALVVTQTSSQVSRWVEAVGTSIINGAEVVWRVIVAGVDEALAAVTALARRIGAKVEAWIEWLAQFFVWDDFLAASDEALGFIEEKMGEIGPLFDALRSYKEALAASLRETVEAAIGRRSIAGLFGVDVSAAAPVIEQLSYIQEKAEEIFDALDFAAVKQSLAGSVAVGPSAAMSAGAQGLGGAVSLGSPTEALAFVNTPISELLAGKDAAAGGSPSLLDSTVGVLLEEQAAMTDKIVGLMTMRLSVPWLTEMLETVVLAGRRLTLARLVALLAAIPAVITEKSAKQQEPSGSARSEAGLAPSARSGGQLRSHQGSEQEEASRREADRSTRWALYVATAFGFINTVVIVKKTMSEVRSGGSGDRKDAAMYQLVSGAAGIIRSIVYLGRIPALPLGTRTYGAINTAAEAMSSLYTASSGMRGLKDPRPGQAPADWSTVDMVVQSLFGLIVITSSCVAVAKGEFKSSTSKTAFGLRCGSWVLALAVRAFEKIDDKDTSGRIRYVTMGLAGASVVVELSEAIYGNVSDVDER